jgi:hypothetical protein
MPPRGFRHCGTAARTDDLSLEDGASRMQLSIRYCRHLRAEGDPYPCHCGRASVWLSRAVCRVLVFTTYQPKLRAVHLYSPPAAVC